MQCTLTTIAFHILRRQRRYELLFKKKPQQRTRSVCIVRMKYDLIEAQAVKRKWNYSLHDVIKLYLIRFHSYWVANVDVTGFFFVQFRLFIASIIMNLHCLSCMSFHSAIYERFYSFGLAISVQSVARNGRFFFYSYWKDMWTLISMHTKKYHRIRIKIKINKHK